MKYYAHSNSGSKENWQSLSDHLNQTAERASNLLDHSVASHLARVAGFLHDLGKYSREFQSRLEGANIRVQHANDGAKALIAKFNNDPFMYLTASILGHVIVGHHAGLPDSGTIIDLPSEATFQARIKRVSKELEFEDEISLPFELPTNYGIKNINYSGETQRNDKNIFSLSFLTRVVFSAVVDADFLDTETFMRADIAPRGEYEDLLSLAEKLANILGKFAGAAGQVNHQRAMILDTCIQKATLKKGFFKLSVPTGGGKTLSSMAFALKHANFHGQKRVIYVIPYTSIIEQNATVFRDVFGIENVLEHHSNFDQEKLLIQNNGENVVQKLKLAGENWDIPIVVTTNVQFFESIYAARGSSCRKVHNMTNSVIVLDEIQMLPTEYLLPILAALDELVTNYGSTVVFSTATQPSLASVYPRLSSAVELMDDPNKLYEGFKRVKVEFIAERSDDQIAERMREENNAICVVNTRPHAREIFKCLSDDNAIYLSTYLCPKHRGKVIEDIRNRLKNNQPCMVVSTQLIEAGVDLDFTVGFRALAGLDSIIQVAGRVNREGKNLMGKVFVFEPDGDVKRRTPISIRQKAEIAREIFEDFSDDPTSLQAVAAYYERLYSVTDRSAFDKENILERFTLNQRLDKKTGNKLFEPNFPFRKVAEDFRLISTPTTPLIIPWDDQANGLIEQVRVDLYPRRFTRKLQPYVVDVYDHELARLQARGAVVLEGEVFNVLTNMDFYCNSTGLNVPDDSGGNAVFL